MKKSTRNILIIVCVVILGFLTWFFVFREKSPSLIDKNNYSLEPKIFENDTQKKLPKFLANDPNADNGPWNNDIYLSTSEDGLTFTNSTFFMSRAGVPHIMQDNKDRVIATFQYFSFAQERLFDKIVYTISEDNGTSWSQIKEILIDLSNLSLNKNGKNPNVVDPFLVQLDNGDFRLYFTFQEQDKNFPTLYSATSKTIDGTFVAEGPELNVLDRNILDPVVIKIGDTWHHYTTYHDKNGLNFHSISTDGNNFVKQTDISSEMSFLGDVIKIDDGYRFYGTGHGIQSAFSTDGYTWIMDSGVRQQEGADPGVVRLNNGSYIMLYTGMGK